jgi:NAD(P)H-dependent flavin oxidoreductase YrpB (nitropropane dioxygenase family)
MGHSVSEAHQLRTRLRAAQVLGAEFAYIGTAFIAAHEANAREEYKGMVVASPLTISSCPTS